jgi:hypothetical protein
MAKPFIFEELENVTATVQSSTLTVDDMMGESTTWTAKSAVGATGVIAGSLQSLNGQRQEDLQARFAQVVDYVFYPYNKTANLNQIANGDRLSISSKNYDILHSEDETGAGLSQVIYLRRID